MSITQVDDSENTCAQTIKAVPYVAVTGGLVTSLECFIEITPDFLCPFINY